jgi:DNA-binding IclR family transcriptional regulator
MHRGASGKILAAYLEASERHRVVQAAATPGLEEELERIRDQGFAFTAGELDGGAAAVAAPILDRRGRIAAGLSVAGPEQRVAADPERVRDAVLAAAHAIESAQRA